MVSDHSIADANKPRPLEILENTFSYLLKKAQQLAPKNGFRFNGHISVLDSSSISLSLKLMPWSQQTRNVGGVKLRAAIDLAGDLPEVIVLEPARIKDLRVARKEFKFKKGTTVIFDKGYSDFEWFRDLNDAGVWRTVKIYPPY